MNSHLARRLALLALTASSLATLICCVVDAPWTPHLFAAALAVFPVSLMLLGATQSGGTVQPTVLTALALLLLLLAASMAGLFWTRGSDATLFGLPAGVVLLVVGLFLLPLALSTLAFAVTFEDPADEYPRNRPSSP